MLERLLIGSTKVVCIYLLETEKKKKSSELFLARLSFLLQKKLCFGAFGRIFACFTTHQSLARPQFVPRLLNSLASRLFFFPDVFDIAKKRDVF